MDDRIKDKAKLQEILNELSDLKKYCNELSNNTRGEKLEKYINGLSKSITSLNNLVEQTIDENYEIE